MSGTSIAKISVIVDKSDIVNKSDKSSFSPREIVSELDRHIVGQADAKRAVAIALRNRWRRQRVEDDLREEIMPNNIILIGPTGVGKTEIARRLARERGLDLSLIKGTGPGGRIVEKDILEYTPARAPAQEGSPSLTVKAYSRLLSAFGVPNRTTNSSARYCSATRLISS